MTTTGVLIGLLLLVLGFLAGLLAARRFGAEDASVSDALEPLGSTIDRVREQLDLMERERGAAYGALHEQVRAMSEESTALRRETGALVTALRSPAVRGRWGEMQLRRIVESAGMIRHCDFDEQPTAHTDDGRLRPDLVVRLTGGRTLVVDAKVPFAGFVEAMDARDEATRRDRLRAHARHLRMHVDSLSSKGYAGLFGSTPEFVVLFVPSDSFLIAALEHDPALLEHGFDRDIVIASPATLVALLRTVAYTWRQETVAANAEQVLALGRELHSRLATLGGHMARLGSALGAAVSRYNETVGSLERKVLVSARRFTDLEVATSPLVGPRPVGAAVRPLQAEELLASASDTLIDLTDERRRAAHPDGPAGSGGGGPAGSGHRPNGPHPPGSPGMPDAWRSGS